MGTAAFERNARVKIEDSEFVLRRKVSDTCWQLENPKNGRVVEREQNELIKLYMVGQLKFLVERDDSPHGKSHVEISPREQEKIAVRLRYVRAVDDLPTTQAAFEQAISCVWRGLQHDANSTEVRSISIRPPGWITVYRWASRYRTFNDAHALLGHRTRKRMDDHAPELLEICEEANDKVYLTRERNNLQDALDYAKQRVKEVNETRGCQGLSPLKMPKRRLLQKLLRNIPAFDIYAARYGRQAALVKFRSVKGHRVTDAPLERAEIDHTPLDLFVVDDRNMLPLGRPYITLCIDDFTRCILGVYVGFVPPSYLSVALCLKQAFLPKAAIKDEYPAIKNEWPAYGVMRELVVDQALEFHSGALEQACLRLGIEVHYSPRKQAWFKGKIERVIRTLNEDVAHGTSGTTFSNIVQKGDYNPENFAVVRLSILKTAIHMWICDVYHQRRHRTLRIPPAEMWMGHIKSEEIRLPEDRESLDVIMGRPYRRILSHKGVEFEGLLYNSDLLHELRLRFGPRLPVEIRVDEGDIGSVYVLFGKEAIRANALNFAYANRISLWQHKLFQANSPTHDPDTWLETKEQIRQMFESEFAFMRRRHRRGVGRYLEGQNLSSVETIALEESLTPAKSAESSLPDRAITLASESSMDRPHYKPIIQARTRND